MTKCGFLKYVNVKGSFDVVMVNATLLTPYKHKYRYTSCMSGWIKTIGGPVCLYLVLYVDVYIYDLLPMCLFLHLNDESTTVKLTVLRLYCLSSDGSLMFYSIILYLPFLFIQTWNVICIVWGLGHEPLTY